MSDVEERRQEIIIVRRSGDGDHDHHGGAWKIAFADFMTAMMCFFLVMWLINASNEQTKAAVASYFNPVKLVDRNSSSKGIDDADGGETQGSASSQEPTNDVGQPLTGPVEERAKQQGTVARPADEQRLFSDPYAVLAEIASETDIKQNLSDKGDGGAQESGPASGASGGEAYRDPFAPDFWSQQVAPPSEAEASAENTRPATMDAPPTVDEAKAEPAPTPEAMPAPPPAPVQAAAEPAVDKPASHDAMAGAGETKPAPAEQTDEPSKATIEAADRIRAELAEALLPGDKLRDGIAVKATDRGVVVSVTDQLEFGMFEIGSALPRRDLVLAMQKIGAALAEQKGSITIGGFTDARPYRSKDYDNWRLSSERAQSAYYMLVRGGLDERRIVAVAGHADREPKDPADPMAAINRRIEILLEIKG
jgi:chemotaxis protein MotB